MSPRRYSREIGVLFPVSPNSAICADRVKVSAMRLSDWRRMSPRSVGPAVRQGPAII
jgi:hypothetical protein